MKSAAADKLGVPERDRLQCESKEFKSNDVPSTLPAEEMLKLVVRLASPVVPLPLKQTVLVRVHYTDSVPH